jgi:pimeloyl-ACP methyl ester carboxylesterase
MRFFLGLVALSTALAIQNGGQEFTHFSQVMGADRVYRVYLPATYANSKVGYPVIYWLHGFEQSSIRDSQLADIGKYVAAHNVIVVDFGPAETTGEFPLYFPELVERIDQTLRTIPDRDQRAISGYGPGGFLAQWIAAKFPDLVASASGLASTTEAQVGPKGFAVACSLDDLDFEGVRRAAPPTITEALDFHMGAFAAPAPKPAVFTHADPYPNFSAWGWEAASNRRQPGFTLLDRVSTKGFHSSVREWLPGGAALPNVKLSLETPLRMYPPGSVHSVTYIHLPDGKIRRSAQKADAQGRLSFELDGGEYEVGISAEPAIVASGYEIADAAWAAAGEPVKLRVKFWNLGAARSGTLPIQWESPDAGVKFENASSRLFGLGPGESVTLPVTFTANVTESRAAMVRIVAVEGANRMPVSVPLFPPAQPVTNFLIADGRPLEAFQHGAQKADVVLGQGNGDGHAAPGESFAILLPDADSFRVAELFTNDACVDNTVRLDDAGARYSVPRILPECEPGHRIRMLARVETPDHAKRYATIEFPVWYRTTERK